jgi:hypothetical protein
MNVEQLEHELNNRKGAIVTVVRPGFGTQSDSWVGTLTVTHADYPMIFQVACVNDSLCMIFRGDDITSVDTTNKYTCLIIRLKGPLDYLGKPVTA